MSSLDIIRLLHLEHSCHLLLLLSGPAMEQRLVVTSALSRPIMCSIIRLGRLRLRRRAYTSLCTSLPRLAKQSKHGDCGNCLAPSSLHWQKYIETKDVEVPSIYICILAGRWQGAGSKLRSASSAIYPSPYTTYSPRPCYPVRYIEVIFNWDQASWTQTPGCPHLPHHL